MKVNNKTLTRMTTEMSFWRGVSIYLAHIFCIKGAKLVLNISWTKF